MRGLELRVGGQVIVWGGYEIVNALDPVVSRQRFEGPWAFIGVPLKGSIRVLIGDL